MNKDEQLITVGVIAERVQLPLHRVEYFLRSRHIKPMARAGNFRVFQADVVDRVRRELRPSARAIG